MEKPVIKSALCLLRGKDYAGLGIILIRQIYEEPGRLSEIYVVPPRWMNGKSSIHILGKRGILEWDGKSLGA